MIQQLISLIDSEIETDMYKETLENILITKEKKVYQYIQQASRTYVKTDIND